MGPQNGRSKPSLTGTAGSVAPIFQPPKGCSRRRANASQIASASSVVRGVSSCGSRDRRRRAARAWEHWGGQVTLGGDFDPHALGDHVTAQTVNQARIELHYAVNGYFLAENQILEACDRITSIPLQIIHGRRDLVCPVESAFTLYQRLPGSTLKVLPNAGHIASGEEMIDALVEATMNLTRLLGSRV